MCQLEASEYASYRAAKRDQPPKALDFLVPYLIFPVKSVILPVKSVRGGSNGFSQTHCVGIYSR